MEDRGGSSVGSFEQIVLPHLDAAFNLARWLLRNKQDAEDVVQEAYLRAFRFFGGYHGGDSRAWVFAIVRNTCYSFLEKNRAGELTEEFDEEIHTADSREPDAELALLKAVDSNALRKAMEELPVTFRETLVLREFEGMSYKQIAEIMGTPIGTVMSSLARARTKLRESLLRSHGRKP